jgi:hypothetical protein
MEAMPTRSGRGGARPGAGRPRLGKEKRLTVAVCLPPDVVEWLDGYAPGSRSELVFEAIGYFARTVEKRSAGRTPAPPSVRHGATGQK